MESKITVSNADDVQIFSLPTYHGVVEVGLENGNIYGATLTSNVNHIALSFLRPNHYSTKWEFVTTSSQAVHEVSELDETLISKLVFQATNYDERSFIDIADMLMYYFCLN